MRPKEWQSEVDNHKRFEFGSNWKKFLSKINSQTIEAAVQSLQENLEEQSLQGKTFLDIGCGSGLFSLAARKLGARVTSFDFDPHSVECTTLLKNKYFPEDDQWEIHQSSVLCSSDMKSFDEYDIVYSWGVLHHTGDMWKALENTISHSRDDGKVFVALYNDQGVRSRVWWWVKKIYVKLPSPLKIIYSFLICTLTIGQSFFISCLTGNVRKFFRRVLAYDKASGRGMSWWRDQVDWIGGFPFEVSKPEEIFTFFHKNGYSLERLKTCGGGFGCNEYVFKGPKPCNAKNELCHTKNKTTSHKIIAA